MLGHGQAQKLSELFLLNLRSLVDASNKPTLPGDAKTIPVLGISPSDFPLAASVLSQDQLDLEFGTFASQIENVLPLTPLQQGMLFDTLREPQSQLYVTQLVSSLSLFTLNASSDLRA